MSANSENIKRLTKAAWTGIEIELASQNASAEDVVNAAFRVAVGAIDYACNCGNTEEEKAYNRANCAAALQALLLKCSNNLKVF
jgi:hypothetical protein